MEKRDFKQFASSFCFCFCLLLFLFSFCFCKNLTPRRCSAIAPSKTYDSIMRHTYSALKTTLSLGNELGQETWDLDQGSQSTIAQTRASQPLNHPIASYSDSLVELNPCTVEIVFFSLLEQSLNRPGWNSFLLSSRSSNRHNDTGSQQLGITQDPSILVLGTNETKCTLKGCA